MSSSSSSSFPLDHASPPPPPYPFNGKVIFVAFFVLALLSFFILALHIYARWAFRRSYNRRRSFLARFDFILQPPPPEMRLDKSVVASLPTFVYHMNGAAPQSDGLECAVCLCEFQENEKGRLLPNCRHSFHIDCIDMWFLSHTTCPICRASADHPAVTIPASFGQEPDAYIHPGGQRSANDEETEIHPISGDLSTPNGEEASIVRETGVISPRLRGCNWQRSISDTFTQRQEVQFPVNVLFWGNHASDVSSRVSSRRLEPGQRGARSFSHMVIDIPRTTQGSFLSPRSGNSSHIYTADHSSMDQQSESCSSPPPLIKVPAARLKSFKRLLSRDRKTSTTEQELGNHEGHSGARLLGPEMYM